MTKIINEILGTSMYGDPTISNQSQNIPTNIDPRGMYNPSNASVGVELNKAPFMYGWQTQITNELNQHDMFIATRTPGGGKTLPVFVYWADNLLGLNTKLLYSNNPNQVNEIFQKMEEIITKPENLPKILWVTPFRALNDQTVSQEFVASFVKIFMQIVNITQSIAYSSDSNSPYVLANNYLFHIMSSISGNYLPKVSSLANQLNDLYQQRNSAPDDNSRMQIINYINQISKELFGLYEQIFMRFISARLVGNEYEGDHSGSVNGIPKPVVVSIYESADGIINRYKPGDLRLIVFDEIQKTHPTQSFDKSQDARAKQISSAIHNILTARAVNRAKVINPARLVLLSGTENEKSANALTFFYNTAYNRNFPEQVQMLDAGNIAHITIQPFDRLRDYNYLPKLIKEMLARKERGSLFLFFSKMKIRKLAEMCATGNKTDVFRVQKTNVGTADKRYYNPSDVSSFTGRADASQIKNDLLRKSVASGFGFTYSLQKTEIDFYPEIQNDNQIVQELFRTGKIYILFATDNVEAGMNINVRNMYIPTFEKLGKQIPIDSRGQILNRVGRQAIDCTIYTPTEHIKDVESALNAVNADYANVPPIMTPEAKARYVMGLAKGTTKDVINMGASIYRSVFG